MDDKKELLKFLCFVGGMSGYSNNMNTDYIFDADVNDCLIKMYFVMMTEEGHPDKERIYNDFLLAYHSLDKDKQEIVKNEFISICEAQDRNQEQEEKVKRKGEIKYE